MENQDKIYSQFKNAAEKSEATDFPNMDKVWNRVEEKLDKKVLKKENKLWKKIAVAASILLVISVAYQLLKPNTTVEIPQNNVVTNDTVNELIPPVISDSNAVVFSSPLVKENATELLKEQIQSQDQVAVAEGIGNLSAAPLSDTLANGNKLNFDAKKVSNSGFFNSEVYEARSVKQIANDNAVVLKKNKETQKTEEKLDPIMVLDGEITSKNLYKLDENEIETIIELKEPLYIINSVYYTEKEVFGPNPTSPYSPLNKQKIETFTILQPEKAVKIYGEKGKKGIVIVTTKDGKPLDNPRSIKN